MPGGRHNPQHGRTVCKGFRTQGAQSARLKTVHREVRILGASVQQELVSPIQSVVHYLGKLSAFGIEIYPFWPTVISVLDRFEVIDQLIERK